MGRDKVLKYIFIGQGSLVAFLIICTIINPHYLFEVNEGGVSNFGLHFATIVPYSLGFGIAGIYTVLASRMIELRALRPILLGLGLLFLIVLISTYPYKVNHVLDDLHQLLGTVLVIGEFILSIWFSIKLSRNSVNFIILAFQTVGFVLAVLTHINEIHLLFVAEMLTTLSFGVLLVRTTKEVQENN